MSAWPIVENYIHPEQKFYIIRNFYLIADCSTVKDQFGTPQQQEQSRTPLACVDDYNDCVLYIGFVRCFCTLKLGELRSNGRSTLRTDCRILALHLTPFTRVFEMCVSMIVHVAFAGIPTSKFVHVFFLRIIVR